MRFALLLLTIAQAAQSAPCGCPTADIPVQADAQRKLRDFALFNHRRIVDDLVRREGIYLDSLLAALPQCADRDAQVGWLRQLAADTPDTAAFAQRLGACPALGMPPSAEPDTSTAGTQRPDAAIAADMSSLAHAPGWLALLHYRRTAGGQWQSQADQPGFFLTAGGRSAPRDELDAAIASMQGDGRAAFACRFPARYEWLRRHAGMQGLPRAVELCPPLAEWLGQFQGQRISINFASSYLESPSSTFGHTFLKVFRDSGAELQSRTINYAARADERVGELSFIRRGLLGGFPGVADELPFYRRLRIYTEDEGRDIWEYELALDPAELRQLLLHAWETKDGVFNYYFIDENCAYRTLALIDAVRPGLGLLDHFGVATVPVDTIRVLRENGLLAATSVWPAYPKQLRHHQQQMHAGDAALALQLAQGRLAPDQLALDQPARRNAILQLAYEFASVEINRDRSDRATRKDTINAIARARFAADAASPFQAPPPPPNPESGHEGSPVMVGAMRRAGGNALTLSWAGFQHTLSDRLQGFEPHAAITVLQPELALWAGHGPRLERIDWLSVQSTIPVSALYTPRAWRLALDSGHKSFEDGRHMASTLSFHGGRAWNIGGIDLVFAPGAALEASRALPHQAALAACAWLAASRQGTGWSAQVDMDASRFVAGSTLLRKQLRTEIAWHLSRNDALVFSTARQFRPGRQAEIRIAYRSFRRLPGAWR